jgi:predicted transcriptional regulator
MTGNIREKFGLGYLTGKPTRSAVEDSQQEVGQARAADTHVERATATLGREVLLKLKTLKDTGCDPAELNRLVDAVNIDRDTLGMVVERLAELRLVEISRERYGNHSIKLTQTGEDSLNLPSP